MSTFLRKRSFLALAFLLTFGCGAPLAQSLDPANENPFVAGHVPLETRLAELRDALRLTADQEKLFAVVADKMRKGAQELESAMVAAAIERNREPRLAQDPAAKLRARADRLSRHVENLRALADAETSFLASLTEEQRRTAESLLAPESMRWSDGFRHRRRMGRH